MRCRCTDVDSWIVKKSMYIFLRKHEIIISYILIKILIANVHDIGVSMHTFCNIYNCVSINNRSKDALQNNLHIKRK